MPETTERLTADQVRADEQHAQRAASAMLETQIRYLTQNGWDNAPGDATWHKGDQYCDMGLALSRQMRADAERETPATPNPAEEASGPSSPRPEGEALLVKIDALEVERDRLVKLLLEGKGWKMERDGSWLRENLRCSEDTILARLRAHTEDKARLAERYAKDAVTGADTGRRLANHVPKELFRLLDVLTQSALHTNPTNTNLYEAWAGFAHSL